MAAATGGREQPAPAVKSWPQLAEEIAHAVRRLTRSSMEKSCASMPTAGATSKICCSAESGRTSTRFDLLACDGRNVRDLPLMERKQRLAAVMPRIESRLLQMDWPADV